jgi:soluble lytic murein transglycosylase-like protein
VSAILVVAGLLLMGQRGSTANPEVRHYLQLRRHYGITAAASEAALESFVGVRVVEIEGSVSGVLKMNGTNSLMISRPDGNPQPVTADTVPEWLEAGNVSARMLVRAYRKSPEGALTARLLAVSPAPPVEAEDSARLAREEAASRRKASLATRFVPTTTAAKRVWTLPASQACGYYAAFIKRENPRLSAEKAYEIAQAILGFSIHFGVDARLIMAMVMVESGFDPTSTSHSGAQGLGQLMPGTARWMGVSNAYDTTENLYGTVKLVRTHLQTYRAKTGDAFASLVLMLAAYNAGEGAVARHGGVPPYRETQAYVRRVIQLYRRFSGY